MVPQASTLSQQLAAQGTQHRGNLRSFLVNFEAIETISNIYFASHETSLIPNGIYTSYHANSFKGIRKNILESFPETNQQIINKALL